VVGLACLASTLRSAERATGFFEPRIDSQVSEAFAAEYRQAASTIPENVRQGLEESGWRVALVEFVVDAAPELRDIQPRGWPSNITWQQVDAVHLPESRLLVVAEKRRGQDGETLLNNRLAGAMRHEIGHAFDMLSARQGNFQSGSSQFHQAYLADARRMDQKTRARLRYYFQKPLAGKQEAFAEAFAVALGGGSDEIHGTEFAGAFPNVLRYVQQQIEAYRATGSGN
jgi:hypothetical protein